MINNNNWNFGANISPGDEGGTMQSMKVNSVADFSITDFLLMVSSDIVTIRRMQVLTLLVILTYAICYFLMEICP